MNETKNVWIATNITQNEQNIGQDNDTKHHGFIGNVHTKSIIVSFSVKKNSYFINGLEFQPKFNLTTAVDLFNWML